MTKQSFGKWGELAGSASAQLVDLFPVFRKLPRWLAPNVKYSERLHEIEKRLYVDLWMQSKKALHDHSCHVRGSFHFVKLILSAPLALLLQRPTTTPGI